MYLLFDIGASKTRLAVSSDLERLGPVRTFPTPATAALAATVKKEVEGLLGGERPQAAAGGLTRKLIAVAPALESALAAPFFLENDAALGGLGEAVFGAGRGASVLAYLTISTGVGGVRIVDRAIDRKTVGFEPGHQVINYLESDRSWEDYISGRAVEAETGRSPGEIEDREFWAAKAKIAAAGIYNVILLWSPEQVVIGGAMLKEPGLSLDVIQEEIGRLNKILPSLPPFSPAALGDESGLWGALYHLRQDLKRR